MAKNDESKEQQSGEEKNGGKKDKPAKDEKGRTTNTKLTAADAASMVRRAVPKTDEKGHVVKDKEGNPVVKYERIAEDEVMSFAEYDDRVVVVTKSGEKLEGPK